MIDYDKNDWWRITLSLHGTIIPRIWKRILILGLLALAALVWSRYLGLPLPTDPLGHSVLGVALGLLLVFRNSSSYERYWEGRRMWGTIINASRNLMRGARQYGVTSSEGEKAHALDNLVIAFSHALMHHLRGEREFPELETLLPPEIKAQVTSAPNVPGAIAWHLTGWIHDRTTTGRLLPQQAQLLEGLVSELINCQGACERILKTPIPFGHAAHIRQMLVLYLGTLPLVLAPKLGWSSIPAAMIIGFGLMGIEEAGIEIEDPFGTDPNDLPVEGFCETIARDSQTMAEMQQGRM